MSKFYLFWLIVWFGFVSFFGSLDVELVIIVNFLIAFFFVLILLSKEFNFNHYFVSFRKKVLDNKKVLLFVIKFFKYLLINFMSYYSNFVKFYSWLCTSIIVFFKLSTLRNLKANYVNKILFSVFFLNKNNKFIIDYKYIFNEK